MLTSSSQALEYNSQRTFFKKKKTSTANIYFFDWKKNIICHGHFSSFTAKICVDFANGTSQVPLAKFKSFLPLALFSLSLPLFRNLPLSRKFATGKKKTLYVKALPKTRFFICDFFILLRVLERNVLFTGSNSCVPLPLMFSRW